MTSNLRHRVGSSLALLALMFLTNQTCKGKLYNSQKSANHAKYLVCIVKIWKMTSLKDDLTGLKHHWKISIYSNCGSTLKADYELTLGC